jgi:hypothetical protein
VERIADGEQVTWAHVTWNVLRFESGIYWLQVPGPATERRRILAVEYQLREQFEQINPRARRTQE